MLGPRIMIWVVIVLLSREDIRCRRAVMLVPPKLSSNSRLTPPRPPVSLLAGVKRTFFHFV